MEAYWDQAGLPSQANGHSAPPHPVKFERWEKFHNLFLQLYFSFRRLKIPLSYCVGTIRKYNIYFIFAHDYPRATVVDTTRVFGLNSVHSTCNRCASSPLFFSPLFIFAERAPCRPTDRFHMAFFSAMCNATIQSRLQHVVVCRSVTLLLLKGEICTLKTHTKTSLPLSVLSSRNIKARI